MENIISHPYESTGNRVKNRYRFSIIEQSNRAQEINFISYELRSKGFVRLTKSLGLFA